MENSYHALISSPLLHLSLIMFFVVCSLLVYVGLVKIIRLFLLSDSLLLAHERSTFNELKNISHNVESLCDEKRLMIEGDSLIFFYSKTYKLSVNNHKIVYIWGDTILTEDFSFFMQLKVRYILDDIFRNMR